MISIIQNLRIGTKLAVTSALTILLVAGMIYLQITGGMQIREASETASRQQAVAANAGEAKASVRGMQVGTRDIVLAKNSAELQAAVEYFNTRKASTLKYLGELTKLSTSAENRQRMAKLTELTEAFDKGKDQFLAYASR
jgi:CHASE3 domain sensor protein